MEPDFTHKESNVLGTVPLRSHRHFFFGQKSLLNSLPSLPALDLSKLVKLYQARAQCIQCKERQVATSYHAKAWFGERHAGLPSYGSGIFVFGFGYIILSAGLFDCMIVDTSHFTRRNWKPSKVMEHSGLLSEQRHLRQN